MENIDDWLYIVFLAIAGISSLFSSVKRKRVQQPIPDQEDTDLEPPFGEPMEEMPSQRTFRMPDEVFQTQPAGADPAALMGKRRSRLKTAQGKMPDTPTPAAQAPTTPPAEAAPERSWLDNPSDLRRAILCAEILNRKYDQFYLPK